MTAAVWSPALSKEIRALLPLWGASVAALLAALVWQEGGLRNTGLLAYVVGSVAIGAQSIGQEYSYRTLPMLLSQPVDRRRVYLLKFGVSAVMLLTLAALAWNVFMATARHTGPWHWRLGIVTLPLLCGLFLAPLLTMASRSTLAGMILSLSGPAWTWFATIALACWWFGIDVDAAENVVFGPWILGMAVLSPIAGLAGWRRFAALDATEGSSTAFHVPRWLRAAEGARGHAPLRALAAKELRLQQLTFVVTGVHVLGWTILWLSQRYIPAMSTFPVGAVMLLYCIGQAIMIGALASAEERQHGTLDWQLLQPVPAWQQWMVKVGVALSLALVCGVGLPLLLIQLTPYDTLRATRMSGDLAVLVVALTTSTIYISSLSSSGVRAMVWSLPAGMAVAYFVQIVRVAMRWATLALAGPWMAGIVSGAIAPPSLHPADVMVVMGRALSLTLVPLLLWFGFVNHTTHGRTSRHLVRQIASIATLIAASVVLVGVVLAFHELRSR